jgi:hypothetical protein
MDKAIPEGSTLSSKELKNDPSTSLLNGQYSDEELLNKPLAEIYRGDFSFFFLSYFLLLSLSFLSYFFLFLSFFFFSFFLSFFSFFLSFFSFFLFLAFSFFFDNFFNIKNGHNELISLFILCLKLQG